MVYLFIDVLGEPIQLKEASICQFVEHLDLFMLLLNYLMLCFVIFDIEETQQYVANFKYLLKLSLTLSHRLDISIELENDILDILIPG
jgi:hypothetical protein